MRFTAIIALAMASIAMAQDGTTWLSEVDCEEVGDAQCSSGYTCTIDEAANGYWLLSC